MKKRNFAAFTTLLAVAVLWSGCSGPLSPAGTNSSGVKTLVNPLAGQAGQPATHEVLPYKPGPNAKSVPFRVQTANQRMLEALDQGSSKLAAAVKASDSSRATMFVTQLYFQVYDLTTGGNYYTDTYYATPGGPGGSVEATLELETGHTFTIYAYTTNSTENPYGTLLTGAAYNVDPNYSTYVSLTLVPYSPVTLYDYGSGSEGQYSDYIIQSVYDSTNRNFTAIGGEKWYAFQSFGNVFHVEFTPDPGVTVYAAVFDSKGQYLTAGVSPSFVGGDTNVVSLETGSSVNGQLYVGVVAITTDPGMENQFAMVTTQPVAATVTDDFYDDYYGYGNDSSDTLNAVIPYIGQADDGIPISLTGLMALDVDNYEFYAPVAGLYEITVNVTDPNFPDGYVGTLGSWSDSSEWVAQYSAYDETEGKPIPQTTYAVTINVTNPGYQFILASFQSIDPNFGFPKLAGSYDLEVNYAGVPGGEVLASKH